MRLRQAVYDWLSEHLKFDQHVMGIPLADHVQPNPLFVQLVDYLRQGRKMHSEDDPTLESEIINIILRETSSISFWKCLILLIHVAALPTFAVIQLCQSLIATAVIRNRQYRNVRKH